MEIDTTSRFQILNKADGILHRINNLGKGMNLPPAMDKIEGQSGFFHLRLATNLWERNLNPILSSSTQKLTLCPSVCNCVRIYNICKVSKVSDHSRGWPIATTPRCRGGRYSIPWIAPLYPWTVPYNAEC